MYYLNSKIVLVIIIVSYQCLTMCNSQIGKTKKRTSYVSRNSDCHIWVPKTDTHKKPMVLENFDIYSLICPDHNEHVNIKHNKHFTLSCENSQFASPEALKQISRVNVKCKKGNTLEVQGQSYEYEEFKCEKNPESKAKIIEEKCQEVKPDKHTNKNAAMAKYKVVMVRHGESEWNQKNLFCGWYDASLSSKGDEEAANAGKALKQGNYKFDVAHTSVLKRAQNTLNAILKELGQENIPVQKTWRLNERHYGSLTGLNKAETAAKYGEKQVQIWRRSYDTPPPPMDKTNPYYEQIVNDVRYKDGPAKDEFPMFESLKLTIKRTLPYWNDVIIPQLKEGKRILIAAHGNSLRGIVKHLDNMTEDQIMNLNLPTGIPFEYELDKNFKPVVSMKFLGDEETVKKAIEAVAAQGKVK